MTEKISGGAFKQMVAFGAACITAQKQAINDLNVFPVPDGDTGTNMSLTIQTAVNELRKAEPATVDEAAKLTASGLLRGARGNSTAGKQQRSVFPIVCRVDNSADATNSFTSLTVDFETMTAHWAESGSCVYSKAGTRQTHLAAVERAGGNFAQADFHYNYPMIGSILEQDGQFYAFLESSTINPAGLSLMGYYWYLELEENGLFKKKLWGKDNLSRLPGKHGMRGKFSGDRTCLILSPIFKNDDWKGKQKVLRLSDLVLIDLAMPRGYASFHVLDVWGNRAFLSDEKDKLVLCEMTLE